MPRCTLFLSALTLFALVMAVVPPDILAQDESVVFVPDETKPFEGQERSWNWKLNLGSNVQFNSSRNVLGQTDGEAWTLGLSLDSLAQYYVDRHEWRNSLSLTEGFSRTQVLPEWVKSTDDLALESIYLYHFKPFWGLYGRLALRSPIFGGEDIRPAPVTYSIARLDGTVQTVTSDRLSLTDPLKPLTLKESIGPFLRPLTSPEANLEFRVGLGMRQVFARGQLGLTDSAATDLIEITELESYQQAGAEFVALFWGEAQEGRLSYKVSAEFMTPFYDSLREDHEEDSAWDQTNVNIEALLSVKLVKWASLDYKFAANRQPRLLDKYQVQSSVLLTFTYTVANK